MANFKTFGLNYWETVEHRCVHAAMRLTSIEFSFDPCNIYRDVPRGVGYPADARSVGDSHPSCSIYPVIIFSNDTFYHVSDEDAFLFIYLFI